jgi:phosphosulfolactate phosphohydrolase-like enzyme
VACFEAMRADLLSHLARCISGKEKQERGRAEDIALAGALDSSVSVPVLKDGAYRVREV